MQESLEPIAEYYPIEDGIPFPDDFKRELRFETPQADLNYFQHLLEILAN